MNAVEKSPFVVVSVASGAEPAMLSSSAVAARCVSLSVSDGAVPIAAINGPWIVTVTTCGVPSSVVTVKLSISVPPTLSACTVLLALLSV